MLNPRFSFDHLGLYCQNDKINQTITKAEQTKYSHPSDRQGDVTLNFFL